MPQRAVFKTRHDNPELIASAIKPDNTPNIETEVEDDNVITTITRPDTGSLHATGDDYLKNLDVAINTEHDL